MASYSRIPTSELDADVDGNEIPPNVLEAARNLYLQQNGVAAPTDRDALTFVQGLAASRQRAEQALSPASCAAGVPANVLCAASNLFQTHHGRPASSAAEALAFAQVLSAETESSTSSVSGGAAEADMVSDEVPAHVIAAAFGIFERHFGRPAATTAEALAFAQRAVSASQAAAVTSTDPDAPAVRHEWQQPQQGAPQGTAEPPRLLGTPVDERLEGRPPSCWSYWFGSGPVFCCGRYLCG